MEGGVRLGGVFKHFAEQADAQTTRIRLQEERIRLLEERHGRCCHSLTTAMDQLDVTEADLFAERELRAELQDQLEAIKGQRDAEHAAARTAVSEADARAAAAEETAEVARELAFEARAAEANAAERLASAAVAARDAQADSRAALDALSHRLQATDDERVHVTERLARTSADLVSALDSRDHHQNHAAILLKEKFRLIDALQKAEAERLRWEERAKDAARVLSPRSRTRIGVPKASDVLAAIANSTASQALKADRRAWSAVTRPGPPDRLRK